LSLRESLYNRFDSSRAKARSFLESVIDFICTMLIDKLSVFLPAFNEEATVKNVALNVRKVLQDVADEWELIIVNDGSKDATGKIASQLRRQDERIRVVNHESNEGYGASLKSGFYASKYPWIAFIDSDGQFDFAEIPNFIKKQKETGADLVIGYYKKRQVGTFKIFTSKIWELAVFLLFSLKVRDVDCGFKFISKKVIDEIPRLESTRGAFISSELLIKAKKKGFKIVEIPVTHYPRKTGGGTGRNLNVILKSFADLFKLWRKLKWEL
jgi:glycosyltransferase involved in cell wall biosynthesis